MPIRIVLLVAFLLLGPTILPASAAETWQQKGFASFSQGHFEDSGSNIYVSARGRIQIINRLDLNNDGHIDLFVGNGHAHREQEDAYIYFNNGREIDPLRRVSIPTEGSTDGLVADFNRDGKNDLVLANAADNNRGSSFVYYGKDDGLTVQHRQKLQSWQAQSVAASDWNADGWVDLAFACGNPNPATGKRELSVIYWNSPRGFVPTLKTNLPGIGESVLAADLNGDSEVDIALAHKAGITIYWSFHGKLDFDRPYALTSTGHHLEAGDVDGDGYNELVVVTESHVDVHTGSSQGPASTSDSKLELPNPTQAAVADFNQDGRPDLAISCSDRNGNEYTNSYVLWNTDAGFSLDSSTLLPTVNAKGVTARDLNSDGWIDLAISNHSSVNNLSIQSFIYWNHRGRFEFARKTMLPTNGARGSCVGDVDNDGTMDLVWLNFEGGLRAGYNPNSIYWGDGSRDYSVDRRTQLWSVYTVGTIQADFNDDGWVDLGAIEARYALGRPNTLNGVYVWYGGASGYHQNRRVVLSVEGAEGGGVTADLNRDGYLDLIVGAQEKGPNGKLGYAILYGGAGGFSPNRRQVIELGGRGLPPVVADLNRDGYLDLVNGSFGTGLTLVYGAHEGFQLDRMIKKHQGTYGVPYVEVADLNGDRWLDLLVPVLETSDTREGDLFIYYGAEDGLSDDRVTLLPHMTGLDPCVADFNRDGILDILLPNYRSNEHCSIPSYLFWGSAGGFDPTNRLELPGDSGTASLPADFDGDGWIDLFLVNHKREGSRDRAGDPIRHTTASFLYWNGPAGFTATNKTDIPTAGPHAQMLRDPGNIYTRELEEVYVSTAYRPQSEMERAVAIDWKAETPLGTAITFQIRTAATRESLMLAGWNGPEGERSWFRAPAKIPPSRVVGPWSQYRARLTTPNGGATPVLTEVTVEFR